MSEGAKIQVAKELTLKILESETVSKQLSNLEQAGKLTADLFNSILQNLQD